MLSSTAHVPLAPRTNVGRVPVEQTLLEALRDIKASFDEGTIRNRQIDAAEVLRYYRQCDRVYRRYHSRQGALHVGLVPPGTARPAQHGHTRQAELFGEMVKEIGGLRSLEFGCGTGYNIRLLSQWYPDRQWHGVDLSSDHILTARRLSEGSLNSTFHMGDYLRLDLPPQAFDAILAVETLCQSESQAASLREAFRLLRPGGQMMVIDCFRAGPLDSLSADLARAAVLVEKTAAVDEFAEISPWADLARAVGFDVHELVDRSSETSYDLTRLYRMARRFFKLPPIARSLSRRVAPRALQNVICGLLMPYTVGQGFHRYLSVLLTKPK